MAQMPIQLMAARAGQFAGQGTPPPARTDSPRGTYLIDAGGISGNALRPGAMDQAQFKTLLAAARKASAAGPDAATGRVPARAAAPAIPTLTPAQLAALGAVESPAPATPAPTPASTPASILAGNAPAQPSVAGPETTAAASPAPASDIPASDIPASATPASARTVGGPMPRARMGADGVWELPRVPDKDEREMLHGQKWRLVQDPEASRLFLGEDGKFGWDDFVDLINPLQHIPLVNVVYRALTGDEINGAARLVDFAFGPLAGVSTAVDLAFRDVAGGSMADTAVAALFGGDDNSEALAEYTTASATQIADAGRRGSNR